MKFFKNKNDKFVERWHSDAFLDRKTALQIFEDVKKKLKIIPNPYTGWRSAPNQNLKTIFINENGLRSKNFKDLKFKDNCFLLGGSVAWGFGATSNENTPAYQIEKILSEKYNLDFNVINLSEQSHSSIEELNTFVSSFHELKPKMVIFLSGCNDIHSGYKNEYKSIDNYTTILDFFLWGDKIGIIREKNFLKVLIKLLTRSLKKTKKYNDDFYYFSKPNREEIPINLYKRKIDFINNFCSIKGVKVFHFLQPDLFFKKNKSDYEKKYEKFVSEKKDFTMNQLNLIKKELFNNNNKNPSSFFYDLLDCFDDYNETIFFDKNHVTDKGYNIIAEKISEKINKALNE